MIEHSFSAFVSRASLRLTEVESFLETIDGADIVTADKCWIVGGSVRRAVEGIESRADLDLYGTADGIAALRERLTKTGFEIRLVRGKHTLFKRDTIRVDVSERVHYPSPEACLANFDFTICQFAAFYRRGELRLMHGDFSVLDLGHRTLMPNASGVEDWFRVLRRVRKYHGQGFEITPQALEEFVRIARGDVNGNGNKEAHRPGLAGPDPGR